MPSGGMWPPITSNCNKRWVMVNCGRLSQPLAILWWELRSLLQPGLGTIVAGTFTL